MASVFAGQLIARTGRYRLLAIGGSVLATAGMFLMAAMDKNTTNAEVVRNMTVARITPNIPTPSTNKPCN